VRRLDWIDWLAMLALIVGGLNWGSIALFDVNFISANLAHHVAWLPRLIYALCGASGVIMLFEVWRLRKKV